MKKQVEIFMPFGEVDAYGDIIAKDCKVTFAPGIKILKSHCSEDGIRMITDVELNEVSVVPKTFGFNVF